jgi:pyruvate-ferredoxin/flavodoxin oxidoreductase
VAKNQDAVDAALAEVHRIAVPTAALTERVRPPIVSARAPDFVQRVTAQMMAGRGDLLPVSAFPPDGTWPVGTTQVGEAQPGLRDPGVGSGDLHPV